MSRSIGSRTGEIDEGVLHQGRRWKISDEGVVLVWDQRRARWKPWRGGSGAAPPPEFMSAGKDSSKTRQERPAAVFPDASQPSPWFEPRQEAEQRGRGHHHWLFSIVALIAGAAIGGALTYSLVQGDLLAGARRHRQDVTEIQDRQGTIDDLKRDLAKQEEEAGWQDIKTWSGYGSLTTEPVKIPRGRVRIAYSFFGTSSTRGMISLYAPRQEYLETVVDEGGTFTGATPFTYAGYLSLQIEGAEWVVRLQRFQ